jgi:hypothetical protein
MALKQKFVHLQFTNAENYGKFSYHCLVELTCLFSKKLLTHCRN